MCGNEMSRPMSHPLEAGVRRVHARAGWGEGALAADRDAAHLGCHLGHTATLPHLVAVRCE